jgi:DNA-directed RNA polymerase specialized sigma24 family protein
MQQNTQQLFVQLYFPIVSFIEEIIEDHEKARDIAIDVFKLNLAELEGYDSSGDLTEVIRLLQTKALIESFCFLRERSQSLEEANEVEMAELERYADFAESVEYTLIAKELDQLIKSVEDKLSKGERLVMRLFFLEVRIKDAAGIMMITKSTYRVLKHKAFKKYKLAFKAGGFLIVLLLMLSIMAR